MAKTKREYILATCFLSGAAAIISFVSLGTQEWVWADAKDPDPTTALNENNYVRFGLFGGLFHQETGVEYEFEYTTVCDFSLNICALLCGDNMMDNLGRFYDGLNATGTCTGIGRGAYSASGIEVSNIHFRSGNVEDRIFINTGVWLCTILFIIISAVMGLISAGLAMWNTVSSPYQVYFSIFGLYIYNAVACLSILLSIVLWGGMFAQDLINYIPAYHIFSGAFSTKGYATLGYSYWINLASLSFYIISICLLYVRNYLISKEPKVNVQLEDSGDPAIYLY